MKPGTMPSQQTDPGDAAIVVAIAIATAKVTVIATPSTGRSEGCTEDDSWSGRTAGMASGSRFWTRPATLASSADLWASWMVCRVILQ